MAVLYLAVKLHEEIFIYSNTSDAPQTVKAASSLLSLNSDISSEADVMDIENDEHSESYLDAVNFLAQINTQYTMRELNRMESEVLRILGWDLLRIPSCAQFIEAMLTVIGAPHLIDSPALRLNFENVITHWMLASQFRGSTLALSLLSLMLQWTLSEHLAQCVTQSLKSIFKVSFYIFFLKVFTYY